MRIRRSANVMALAAVLAAGCGEGDERPETSSPLEDPAATEASPEVTLAAPEPNPLPGADRARIGAATRAYIAAINAGDGSRVCALFVHGAVREAGLPRAGADCAASVGASIGYRGPGGTPAWRRTKLFELDAVAVEEDRARVTATVSHDFARRDQPSVEEDVIYLDRAGGGWLIAKPSASFYRAIGYPEPPLRALTPP